MVELLALADVIGFSPVEALRVLQHPDPAVSARER